MPIYSGSSGTLSTVGDLVDRVYRDYLHPSDDQPVMLTLASDTNESVTTWRYTTGALAPDEEMLLAPGMLVEAGSELVRVQSVNEDADTITVVRGANGTAATVHYAGDEIIVAPTYSRATVVDAVKDAIVGLYPELWREATVEVTTTSTYVEVPATAVSPIGLLYTSGGRQYSATAEFRRNFSPSSTGKAIVTPGLSAGLTAYFTYRAAFERPADEADALADLGIELEWARIIIVGAAAQAVASRPVDALTAEYITEQLQREALPVESPERIRNGLLALYGSWLADAHKALRGEQPAQIVML